MKKSYVKWKTKQVVDIFSRVRFLFPLTVVPEEALAKSVTPLRDLLFIFNVPQNRVGPVDGVLGKL